MPVLLGMEVTTNSGHMLVFGLGRYTKEMSNALKLRTITNTEGGVMVLAHLHKNSPYVN